MSLYTWVRLARIVSRHANRKAKAAESRRQQEERHTERAERKVARQHRPLTVTDDIWHSRGLIVAGLVEAGWLREDAILAAARLTSSYRSEAERIADAARERVRDLSQ